jgi:hypothetical protein
MIIVLSPFKALLMCLNTILTKQPRSYEQGWYELQWRVC